jgi:hypothetical protein
MSQDGERPVVPPSEYESPRIESEMTEERLSREAQYGGITPPS